MVDRYNVKHLDLIYIVYYYSPVRNKINFFYVRKQCFTVGDTKT